MSTKPTEPIPMPGPAGLTPSEPQVVTVPGPRDPKRPEEVPPDTPPDSLPDPDRPIEEPGPDDVPEEAPDITPVPGEEIPAKMSD